MELENSVWQISLIALIAGALIGALAYRLFASSTKESSKMKSELEDAKAELDSYKDGVSQHFDKTAELVNDLAQNYVKVYKHLAEGAETLGATQPFNGILEQQSTAPAEIASDSDVVSNVDDAESIDSEMAAEKSEPMDYVASPASEEVTDNEKTAIPAEGELDTEVSGKEKVKTDDSR